jgi:cytochrome P450
MVLDFARAMMPFLSVCACVCAGVYLLYQWALPKPIPGIPYHKPSSRHILGSIPDMLRLQSETGATFVDYMIHLSKELDSPIFQVFLGPFVKPHVVLADFWESQDILMRRKEFDRAVESMRSVFAGMIPDHHIHMKTDATWKAHRKLIQDMMLPSVLNSVAGPVVYDSTIELIELWKLKSRIGGGRPFDAHKDVFEGALDAILSVTFGAQFQHHATRPKIQHLDSLDKPTITRLGWSGNPKNMDEPVKFTDGSRDPIIAAILEIADSLDGMPAAPFPALQWAWIAHATNVKHAIKTKKEFIEKEIQGAVERQNSSDPSSKALRSAVDFMVRNESTMADKTGRQPEYLSAVMNDEIFGFIVAGHDTTSTTVNWGVKLLADNPTVTNRLRSDLWQRHAAARAENRNPTSEEIQACRIPYLEATMEEMLRCAGTTPSVDRVALADTQVLGHPISKGTMVLMLGLGPSFTHPGFAIDRAKRNGSVKVGNDWDSADMAAFRPERWLIKGAGTEGEEEFDSTAGPQLSFGLGTRSCFGKKMAYLELRIIVTLLLWNFELLPCPEKLSGYKSIIGITNKPTECYVRLREIK